MHPFQLTLRSAVAVSDREPELWRGTVPSDTHGGCNVSLKSICFHDPSYHEFSEE